MCNSCNKTFFDGTIRLIESQKQARAKERIDLKGYKFSPFLHTFLKHGRLKQIDIVLIDLKQHCTYHLWQVFVDKVVGISNTTVPETNSSPLKING